jgi:hypothetical protein
MIGYDIIYKKIHNNDIYDRIKKPDKKIR